MTAEWQERLDHAARYCNLSTPAAEALQQFAADPAHADLIARTRAALFDGEKIDLSQAPELEPLTVPAELALLAAAVAAIPGGEALCAAQGYPVAVYHEALADVGIWERFFFRNHGRHGLDLRGAAWCAAARRLQVLQFGRLQCNAQFTYHGPAIVCQGETLNDGDEAINLHIPEAGPLDLAACQASLVRMAAFFAACRPEWPWKGWFCHSWFLDPQLPAWLDPASRIPAFQALGACVPDEEGQSDILFRVFGEHGIAGVPKPNAFQRRILTALDHGVRFVPGKLFIPRSFLPRFSGH